MRSDFKNKKKKEKADMLTEKEIRRVYGLREEEYQGIVEWHKRHYGFNTYKNYADVVDVLKQPDDSEVKQELVRSIEQWRIDRGNYIGVGEEIEDYLNEAVYDYFKQLSKFHFYSIKVNGVVFSNEAVDFDVPQTVYLVDIDEELLSNSNTDVKKRNIKSDLFQSIEKNIYSSELQIEGDLGSLKKSIEIVFDGVFIHNHKNCRYSVGFKLGVGTKNKNSKEEKENVK